MDGERFPLRYVNKRTRPQRVPCSPLDVSVQESNSHTNNGQQIQAQAQQQQQQAPQPSPRREYFTFCNPKTRDGLLLSSSKPAFTFQHFPKSLVRWLCPGKSARPPSATTTTTTTATINHNHLVRVILLISVAIALFVCLRGNSYHDYTILPEWNWDHNVYIPRNNNNNNNIGNIDSDFGAPPGNNRISLIAQVSSSLQLQRLTEISSRPNRAYARQWGMDYTRYNAGRSAHSKTKSCFDKVFALNAIMEIQTNQASEPPPLWPHPPRVQYDSILLLPPDSILTELDNNLLDIMLPRDKLVAIAGWNHDQTLNSNSGVIVFNLQHRHADAVTKIWWEMALPMKVTCGANNELGMLVTAIASVMDPNENLDDLIEPLGETSDGFVGNHLIKCIPPSVPGSRSALLSTNIQETRKTLQETADAVCYRFYPKCEVL